MPTSTPTSGRAYSLLEIKAVDAERRELSGIATTPEVDRMGDIVDPDGLEFKNPLPLLLYHDSRQVVGTARLGRPTKDGVTFTAKIPEIAEVGTLRDRVEEAWQSVKAGLIRGVSIGFRVLEDGIDLLPTGGLKFSKAEVLELSLVAIPANSSATIQAVKHFAAQDPAASGRGSVGVSPSSAGVSAQVVRASTTGAKPMKTIAEQIASFEATRQNKSARMTELMNKAAEKGETLDPTQSEEYDGLKAELKSIDEHLARLHEMETINKATAVPVVGTTAAAASASRAGVQVSVKTNVPPGIGMARVCIAKIMARLEGCTVAEIVKQRWPDHSELSAYFQRAAVPAGTTTNALFAGNLVDTTNLESEFIEYLRPQTIIGRIPNLRRVPFNIRVTGQTTGAVANWVGQGKGKPVTSFQTTATTLLYTKIAAIAVITEELARFSSPSAEALVRDELARAVIERMDVDFIDPAHAAVANVNPASITNGVTPLSSAGTSADNIRTDIQNLLEAFLLQNMNAANVVLIMPNTLALAASILRNSLGQPEFPELGINGGTLNGLPVITSQYAANQSGHGNLVIALDPTAIFLADDGQVRLDASREASIEMSDAPTQDSGTPTASTLVSMYQTNSIAIRAERFINWAKARSTAVAFIDDANWGSIGSPS